MVKIYTRRGDDGSTGLSSGKRLRKNETVFEVLGDIDEAQACLGELIELSRKARLTKVITRSLDQAQQSLFSFGAHVSVTPGWEDGRVPSEAIAEIERNIDILESRLPALKNFILASGPTVVTRFHLCRAVVRKLERHIIALAKEQNVAPTVLAYLNRLSDFLFVAARNAAKKTKTKETIWRG